MTKYEKRMEDFKNKIEDMNQLCHWDGTIEFINEMTLEYSQSLGLDRVELFDKIILY